MILGHHFEHIGLLASLKRKGLLETGDYFVVGVDLEQYDPKSPEKYLKGLLQSKQNPRVVDAFRSYVAIVPSAPVGFDEFAVEVRVFDSFFNRTNPLNLSTTIKNKNFILLFVSQQYKNTCSSKFDAFQCSQL